MVAQDSHDRLESLEAMANTGRRVIFYDQLSCGNSDQPHDPSMWTVPLFIEELSVIRRALGLERVHLFGHSWGGQLAMGIFFDEASWIGKPDPFWLAIQLAPIDGRGQSSARPH